MTLLAPIPIVFLAIGAIFLVLSARDYLRTNGGRNIARKTWIRIGLIFAIIGGWYFFHSNRP